MRLYRQIVVMLLLALLAGPARASLIGDEILWSTVVNGSVSGTMPLIVDENTFEYASPLPFGVAILDIADSSIWFAVTNNATSTTFPGLEQYIFSDLDWVGSPGQIVDVILTQDGFLGPPITIDSFTPDSVTVNLAGIFLAQPDISGFFQLNLVVEHDTPGVPLPSGAALLLLGLVLLSLFRNGEQ